MVFEIFNPLSRKLQNKYAAITHIAEHVNKEHTLQKLFNFDGSLTTNYGCKCRAYNRG